MVATENAVGHTKASKAEVERRVSMTMDLLCQGKTTSEIRRALRDHCGIRHRQVNTYIARARNQLLEEIGVERSALVARSYGVYMKCLSDPEASVRDKVAACRAADELLGLQAPKKVAPTSPDGEAAYHEHVIRELMLLSESSQSATVIDAKFIEEVVHGQCDGNESDGG